MRTRPCRQRCSIVYSMQLSRAIVSSISRSAWSGSYSSAQSSVIYVAILLQEYTPVTTSDDVTTSLETITAQLQRRIARLLLRHDRRTFRGRFRELYAR